MRIASPLSLLLAACGTSDRAQPPDAAAPDAPACTPTLLLDGARAPADQGWSIEQQGSASLTRGADFLALTTATVGSTGAMLLLHRPQVVPSDAPFAVELELLVESTAVHNPADAAAAILGSFTPPFGLPAQRAQMIYLDPARLGWADDTASFAAAITNGAYHTYRLTVDAAGTATVTIDGALALTRAAFTTNGTLAVGDQTNDPNFEATLRVRKVTRLCL